jgi:glyoxylase-like metal-dependent hydrolase (beta-lactamase superfamily II)
MIGQPTPDRDTEALKIAARWPGADRVTVVTLAIRLAATGADADGHRYFRQEAETHQDQPLLQALAGFFGARAGDDVPAALARLDAAAAADLGLPQYFRGLALAALPPDRQRAGQAVDDLEFVLAVRDEFPPAMMRAAHSALATAYAALGKDDLAAEASRRSGLAGWPADSRLQFGGFWVTAGGGFRFTAPQIFRPAPGIHVAQGHDFGDFAFIETGEGIVAIDAGTTQARVRAALAEAGLADRPVSHVILTHAHFDHIGGIAAVRGPGTQVITQAAFPAELDRQRRGARPFRYFTGDLEGAGRDTGDGAGAVGDTGDDGAGDIVPDRLITEPTPLTIGGTELVLYPTLGGETGDALMIYLPGPCLLFTGDVMMPYLGAPFSAEGSPEGLLETLGFICGLQPRVLIQGHTPLTEVFTAEAIPGLEAALAQLHGQVSGGIAAGESLAAILGRNFLPEVLRNHPRAVVPYLVTRDHFTARLHHQRTGYWKRDGFGMHPVTDDARAAALDLLAEGDPSRYATAAAALIGQGNPALALEIIEPGLLRHPASAVLTDLRRAALHRLMERHQQLDPFRFLVYAEQAGAEIGPVK